MTKYSNERIIDALRQSGGTISKAARILGCSPWVITSRAKSDESIRNLLSQPRGGLTGKKRFTDDDILRALEASGGLLSFAAEKLGCSRRTIELRAAESEPIAQAIQAHRERVLDLAETQLAKAVKAGKPWAIRFVLSTIGRNRGYTRLQTIDMHQHIIVDIPESFRWKEPADASTDVEDALLLEE